MTLQEHECTAWMVAYVQAREEAFRRGVPRGSWFASNAAVEADEAIELMRKRCVSDE
jgi:hypothetical protein